MQVGLDRIDGHIRHLCDLLNTHLFEKLEQKYPPLIDRKRVYSSLHLLHSLSRQDFGFCRTLARGQKGSELRDIQRCCPGLAPELELLESHMIADQVVGEAAEPWVHGPF